MSPDHAVRWASAAAADDRHDTVRRWAGRAGRGLAATRVALGVGALVRPRPLGRAWIGAPANVGTTAVLLRALAARDLALGAGALLTSDEEDFRRWVVLGALSDLVDTLATIGSFTQLPHRTRWLVLATCAGAAAGGVAAAALRPPIDGPRRRRNVSWSDQSTS